MSRGCLGPNYKVRIALAGRWCCKKLQQQLVESVATKMSLDRAATLQWQGGDQWTIGNGMNSYRPDCPFELALFQFLDALASLDLTL